MENRDLCAQFKQFLTAIYCRSEEKMAARPSVKIEKEEEMKRCVPRHDFVIVFRTNFGNKMAEVLTLD